MVEDRRSWIASARINQPERDHAECGDAGQKEVLSAAEFDKVRQVTAQERRVGRRGISRDDEAALTSVIPHQNVFVVPEVRVVAVLDPLLLNELELAEDAGVERHEDHTAIV